MKNYPRTNLNKNLPIVPVVPGKYSKGDWFVVLLGASVMLFLCVTFWKVALVVLTALFLSNPYRFIMFFRELMAPQRNPFAAPE